MGFTTEVMEALLIPIYEPTDKVLPFLESFDPHCFDAFLVVDDGSGEAYAEIFAEIARKTPFQVVSYPENKGKGFALKHGILTLLKQYPDLDLIVTADGDGQHLRDDILKVRQTALDNPGKVVLGARDFSNAPKKSQSGNVWSARYFRFATAVKISDCQTGLRGLPKEAFDMAIHTYGNRFDYEMNFLMPASREFGIVETKITTVYEDGNQGTHFRPVLDSLLIMRTPIAYILVGVTSFLIDIAAFYLFQRFVFPTAMDGDWAAQLYCHLCARAISFPYNYILLDKVVFHHKGIFHNSLWKYFLLAVSSLFTSFGLTYLFSRLWPSLVWIKVIVDIALGITKYLLNLMITFANRKFGRRKTLH